jgi:hypothetical protein
MDKTMAETDDESIWRCGKVICGEEIWIERARERECGARSADGKQRG